MKRKVISGAGGMMLVDSREETDSCSFLQVAKQGPKRMLSLVSRGCVCPSPEDAIAPCGYHRRELGVALLGVGRCHSMCVSLE